MQGGGKMISPTFKVKSSLTLSGYNQVIDKPTHFINTFTSCINLIPRVDVSMFDKCNIIYGKINIRVPLPPKYVREV